MSKLIELNISSNVTLTGLLCTRNDSFTHALGTERSQSYEAIDCLQVILWINDSDKDITSALSDAELDFYSSILLEYAEKGTVEGVYDYQARV